MAAIHVSSLCYSLPSSSTHHSSTATPLVSPRSGPAPFLVGNPISHVSSFPCIKKKGIGIMLGGVRDCWANQNDGEIQRLARFAVEEHNKKQNSLLEFGRVLKAREQVVAGMMYYLTLEAVDAGKKKIYEAKVRVKPWMNFKQLLEFKYAKDELALTSSDLGYNHAFVRLSSTLCPPDLLKAGDGIAGEEVVA